MVVGIRGIPRLDTIEDGGTDFPFSSEALPRFGPGSVNSELARRAPLSCRCPRLGYRRRYVQAPRGDAMNGDKAMLATAFRYFLAVADAGSIRAA